MYLIDLSYIFIYFYELIQFMMRSKYNLLVQQLDNKLMHFKEAGNLYVPTRGWIHTIRTSLNMTRAQLAVLMNTTKGAVQKIEEREASDQISLKKLRAAGDALDMKLVYGFVPKDGSIENLIHRKAEKLATQIVMRTHQNMQLENQAIKEEKLQESIAELTSELAMEMKKSLWD